MKNIKIILVEDHELLLKGMASILQSQVDFDIIHAFSQESDLLEVIKSDIHVDLLVIDVNLNDNDPELLLSRIRDERPDLKILYLTILRGSRMFHRLQKYGIQGYALKDIEYNKLFEIIKLIINGGTYFAEDLALNFEKDQSIKEKGFLNQQKNILSPRELEILQLICQEYSSAEIAEKLFISTKTVDTHRQNLMIKLGVSNSIGLVKYALKNNLLNL